MPRASVKLKRARNPARTAVVCGYWGNASLSLGVRRAILVHEAAVGV
jgi:hypothetical protein